MPKGAKHGGRITGTPNKITADIKAMVLQALDELGGVEYLKEQAQDNSSSFIGLLSKTLPTQLNHSGRSPKHMIGLRDMENFNKVVFSLE